MNVPQDAYKFATLQRKFDEGNALLSVFLSYYVPFSHNIENRRYRVIS